MFYNARARSPLDATTGIMVARKQMPTVTAATGQAYDYNSPTMACDPGVVTLARSAQDKAPCVCMGVGCPNYCGRPVGPGTLAGPSMDGLPRGWSRRALARRRCKIVALAGDGYRHEKHVTRP
eukprot:2311156-Pyramimonas_sp.AAC.1